MTLSRRTMIGLSVAGTAAMAMRGAIARESAGDIPDIGIAFFKRHGFREVPDEGILTGMDFNGGLRHTIIQPEPFPHAAMGVWFVARPGDIPDRHLPGVLAGFHIFGLQTAPSPEPGALLDLVMEFLVKQRKLDPARMLFVSTGMFRPMLGRLDGIGAEQFLERTVAEAERTGDGSGVFAPADHPYKPRIHTVSLHYRLPGSAPAADLSYPPAGYIEIGEVAIAPIDGKPGGPEIAGFGMERVAMAEGRPVPDFEKSRRNLLRIVEADARRAGKPLPPGYYAFASL